MPNMPTDPAPDFPVVARFENPAAALPRRERRAHAPAARFAGGAGVDHAALPRDGAGPHPRCEVRRAEPARPARHLRHRVRPGGGADRGRERDARRRRPRAFLPRERGADLAGGRHRPKCSPTTRGASAAAIGAGPAHDFPTSITVGGHALHAAGAAYALQYRGEARAGGVRVRRRRDLEGRRVRGVQPRRSVAPAGGVRDHQQPVGDLDPAREADRERDPRAKGTGSRNRGRAGRRQTTSSRCTRRCASGSTGGARAAARPSSRR